MSLLARAARSAGRAAVRRGQGQQEVAAQRSVLTPQRGGLQPRGVRTESSWTAPWQPGPFSSKKPSAYTGSVPEQAEVLQEAMIVDTDTQISPYECLASLAAMGVVMYGVYRAVGVWGPEAHKPTVRCC